MMQNQTFRPTMAPKSKKLAEQYNRRIRAERSKSREKQKQTIKLSDNPYLPDTFYGQNHASMQSIKLYDENTDEKEDGEAAPYEIQKYQRQKFEEKMLARRELERQREEKECTFAPKTNQYAKIIQKYKNGQASVNNTKSFTYEHSDRKQTKNSSNITDFQ